MDSSNDLAKFIAAQPAIQKKVAYEDQVTQYDQDQEFSFIGDGAWSMMPDAVGEGSMPAGGRTAIHSRADEAAELKKRSRLPGMRPLPLPSTTGSGAEMEGEQPADGDSDDSEEGSGARASSHRRNPHRAKRVFYGAQIHDHARHEAFNKITFDEIRYHFNSNLQDVAHHYGVSAGSVSMVLKKLGVKTWPSKAIRALNSSIHKIQTALMLTKPKVEDIAKAESLISVLKRAIEHEVLRAREPLDNLQEDSESISPASVTKNPEEFSGTNSSSNHPDSQAKEKVAQKRNTTQDSLRDFYMHAKRMSVSLFIHAGFSEAEASKAVLNIPEPEPELSYIGPDKPVDLWLKNTNPKSTLLSDSERNNTRIRNRLKKGWNEENRVGNRGRLPVKDELLDVLGARVGLKTLGRFYDSDDNIFEKRLQDLMIRSDFREQLGKGGTTKHGNSSSGSMSNASELSANSTKKRGRILCHDGPVDLPPLVFEDTTEINKEGQTIIVVEPQIFTSPFTGGVGEIVPNFAIS